MALEKGITLRVYIAEDEAINLLGLKRMVAACGHKVIGTAMNGKKAVEDCIKLKPDIVLLDINMPEMDGITAAEKMNVQLQVPIIIITGYKDDVLLERANKAKVFGFLQKPVDEFEIKSILQIAVSRHGELKGLEQERDEAVQSLKDRKVIERAKGILQNRFGLTEEAAMKSMIKKARNENKKMIVIANEIIKADKML